MSRTESGPVQQSIEPDRLAAYLTKPDEHLNPEVATNYDRTVSSADHFEVETVRVVVDRLE